MMKADHQPLTVDASTDATATGACRLTELGQGRRRQ